MNSVTISIWIAKIATPLILVTSAVTAASAQYHYPLVFDSPDKLKPLGIVLLLGADEAAKAKHYPTRCYYYGDGGWDISISNSLLEYYRSLGFSRRSACMALVSGIRFNPETGQRLATYILLNPQEFENGQPNGPDSVSDELPLSLPRCFSRGLPYADCKWKYNPRTGKQLSAAEVAAIKAIGDHVQEFLEDPTVRHDFKYMASDDSPFTKGMIMVGAAQHLPEKTDIAFYDYSAEFPKGYGYALYADGSAGPSAKAEVVKAALDGQRHPQQIDATKLKNAWSTGAR